VTLLAVRTVGAVVLLAGLLATAQATADERITFLAEVNGKPARFVVDTGASALLTATAESAKRLGLTIAHEDARTGPLAGKFLGTSASVRVVLPGGSGRDAVFEVLQPTPEQVSFSFDAIWGWPGVKHRIFHYSLGNGLRLDPSPAVDLSKAQQFPLVPTANVAIFDAGAGSEHLPVLVDTGSPGGVELAKPLWDAWRRAHPNLPVTLIGRYSPATGPVVSEQAFAKRLEIGALVLNNVMVTELPDSQVTGKVQAKAVLGLGVFRNQGLWIDGEGGRIAFLPSSSSPVLYNRGGVSFPPPTMAALVSPMGPASQAGVMKGDILLAIDGIEPAAYAARIKTSSIWQQPPGTVLSLTLRRGDEQIERRVVLEDFLGQP
jgi:hypothetical protein